jgi:hypothetical protein
VPKDFYPGEIGGMKLTEKQVEQALSIFAIPKMKTAVRELTERLNEEIERATDAKCQVAAADVKCACGQVASFISHGVAECFACREERLKRTA